MYDVYLIVTMGMIRNFYNKIKSLLFYQIVVTENFDKTENIFGTKSICIKKSFTEAVLSIKSNIA